MIKRYYATKDNTITNAFAEDLVTRGTGSNMGQSDILEAFSIYGQVATSTEEARIIIEFDPTEIQTDITAGSLDAGAKFYLKLFNAKHGKTLPRNFNLEVSTLTAAWQEGVGLDMEDYSDLTYGRGSSWIDSTGATDWATPGGDYGGSAVVQTFEEGWEDLEVDITTIVNAWLVTPASNYGLVIKLPNSYLAETRSYYTKMFFARSSSHWFKRPTIEARWNSQTKDQRGDFYSGKTNTIFLYNDFRNSLVDLTDPVTVKLYETLGATHVAGPTTATQVVDGIYKADVLVTTTSETIYDVWSADGSEVHTGSLAVLQPTMDTAPPTNDLVVTTKHISDSYYAKQTSRFYFYIRDKNWSPNIYTTAVGTPTSKFYNNLYYKITKVVTDETIFDYDTTDNSTILSYDANGNFFDLDMNMLEPNYDYEIKLSLFNVMTKSYEELPFKHRFRVVNNEY